MEKEEVLTRILDILIEINKNIMYQTKLLEENHFVSDERKREASLYYNNSRDLLKKMFEGRPELKDLPIVQMCDSLLSGIPSGGEK